MRVKITDIADEAGVSPATVSRYLNGHFGSMSEATKERIADIIKRTGYTPNVAARALRREESNVLGVLIADITNPYSAAVLGALSEHAHKAGFSLMVEFSENDSKREAAALERLKDAGVAGLIVNTSGGCDEEIKDIAEHVPVVLLDRDIKGSGLDLVTSNNRQLMEDILHAFIELPIRELVLLSEKTPGSQTRQLRKQIFEELCTKQNVPHKTLEFDSDDDMSQLLDQAPKTGKRAGYITVNSLVLLQFLTQVEALGLTPQKDFYLATFDDFAWTPIVYGGITAAAQHTQAIAHQIIDILQVRMASPHGYIAPSHVEIPGTVIYRASTELLN